MIKARFLLCAGLSFSSMVFAETKPTTHELYVGVGILSSKYLTKGINFDLGDYFDDKWNGGEDHNANHSMKSKTIKKIGYGYRIKDHLFVTLSALSQDYEDKGQTGTTKAMLIGARFEHTNKESLSLYSGLALGQAELKYDNSGDSTKSTAFQVEALGLRVGNQTISGHVSIGYGFEGLIQGGISVRL